MKTQKLRNSNKTIEAPSASAIPTRVWREPTQRMLHIHEQLAAGKFPNATQLAAHFGVSLRTVRRDLDYLRDKLHLPLEYDARQSGFHYTRDVSHPPGMAELSEQELWSLYVAERAVAAFAGTPDGLKLQEIFQRLTGYLSPEKRYTVEGFARILSVRPFAPDDTDFQTMRLVSKAVMKQQVLFFEYRKPGKETTEEREVMPYHVFSADNRWYLIAYDEDRSDYRTFVISRMRNVEATTRTFKRDPNFNAQEYLKNSFKVMTGNGDYVVMVDFDALATDVMRGRQYHPSQKIIQLSGGRSRVTMQLSSLEEVRAWVLQWEDHATVLAPEALKRSLTDILEKIADKYTSEPARLAA